MEKFPTKKNQFEKSDKQEKWNETLASVESIADRKGKPVDEGIKETVVAFLVNNIQTNNSCEGHLDWGRPYPFVDIDHTDELGEDMGLTVQSFLDDFYSIHTPTSPEHKLKLWKGGSFYNLSPISGAGTGRNNWDVFEEREGKMSAEEKENYLGNAQAEMGAFTQYLKESYFS